MVAPRLGALALVKSGDEVLLRLGLCRDGGRGRPLSWLDGVVRLGAIALANLAVAALGAVVTRPRFVEPRPP